MTKRRWQLSLSLWIYPSLVILLTITLQPSAACPDSCACAGNPSGTLVECRARGLYSYPAKVPIDTVELDLAFNSISAPVYNEYAVLQKLTAINLESNNIKTLNPTCFASFPDLQTVNLNSNSIDYVDVDAFSRLGQLRHLHLERNSISELPEGVFRSPLQVLTLNENSLQIIPPGLLSPSLQMVDLSGNTLIELSEDTFKFCTKDLEEVAVTKNRVPLRIQTDTFRNLSLKKLDLSFSGIVDASFLEYLSTETLDISGNSIQVDSLEKYKSLGTVKSLYLSSMNITYVTGNLFRFLTSVELLDLSHNRLFLLDGNTFDNMPHLISLNAQSNQISRFPVDLSQYAKNLRYLIMSFNRIPTFQPDMLDTLQLQTIDLSFNHIQTLDSSLAHYLDDHPNATMLLTGNLLHCNCELQWFKQWLLTANRSLGVTSCATPVTGPQFTCVLPTIVYTNEHVVVEINNDVLFRCSAEGDPTPVITWVSPWGETISTTPPKNKTLRRNHAMWELKKVGLSQVGWYICNASNLLGWSSKRLRLDITVNGTVPYTIPTTLPTTVPTPQSTTQSTLDVIATTSPTFSDTTSSNISQRTAPTGVIKTTTTTAGYDTKTVPSTIGRKTITFTVGQIIGNGSLITGPVDDNVTAVEVFDWAGSSKSSQVIVVIVICCCLFFGLICGVVMCIVIVKCVRKRRNSKRYNVEYKMEYLYHKMDGQVAQPGTGSVLL